SQIDGKDDAPVTVTIGGQPQELKGQSYLYHFAMLQVQFHCTTAYDIIRSVGVNVGKRDYLGPRPTQALPATALPGPAPGYPPIGLWMAGPNARPKRPNVVDLKFA